MRRQGDTTEFDGTAVVEGTIYVGGRPGCEVREVGAAASFDAGDVCVHDHVFCMGLFEDGGTAGGVVGVGVADKEDFDVGEVEA